MSSQRNQALFTRQGHLSDLTIDRYLYDPLVGTERKAIEEHVSECEECRHALARVQSFDHQLRLSPRATPSTPTSVLAYKGKSLRRFSSPAIPSAIGALAAAAALILVLTSNSFIKGHDETVGLGNIRLKGPGFAMSVYVDDRPGGRLLKSSDDVRPGDRLGFEVRTRNSGYLMIGGKDAHGSVYRCYPETGEKAVRVQGSIEPHIIRNAVELDRVLGKEQLLGMWCPREFSFILLTRLLTDRDTELPTGCLIERISIKKTAGNR